MGGQGNQRGVRSYEEESLRLPVEGNREVHPGRERQRMSGSPHTHARYNRRYQGTYGPAIRAGKAKFPLSEYIDGLFMCGDSVFPGIGIPAVAASGANAASSTVSVGEHLKLLKRLNEINKKKN